MKIEVKNIENVDIETLAEIGREVLRNIKIEDEPSLEDMKSELNSYKSAIKFLLDKIKEEESKRKKETNHLIEKKVRTITFNDDVVLGTDRKEYRSRNKRWTGKEIIKYERKDNKIICTVTSGGVNHKGVAECHKEDKFDYQNGMILSRIRAMKRMYEVAESEFVENL